MDSHYGTTNPCVFSGGDWYEILQTTLLPHLRKSWGTLLTTTTGLSDKKSDKHPCRPVENHPSQTSRSRPRPLSSTKATPDINVWCDVGGARDTHHGYGERVLTNGWYVFTFAWYDQYQYVLLYCNWHISRQLRGQMFPSPSKTNLATTKKTCCLQRCFIWPP